MPLRHSLTKAYNYIANIYFLVNVVDTVFCLTPIHVSKQRPKILKKKIENVQNHNMFERWIKKSQHLKNSFYSKYDQDLNEVG